MSKGGIPVNLTAEDQDNALAEARKTGFNTPAKGGDDSWMLTEEEAYERTRLLNLSLRYRYWGPPRQ